MPFNENEVYVGMIAYFTIDDLQAEQALRHTGGSSNGEPRPFVCYATDAQGDLYWTPLTTRATQPGRDSIDKAHLGRATGKFLTEDVLVNDGAHTYAGGPGIFSRLSQRVDRQTARNRPDLTKEGVEFVLAIVTSRGGLLPQ